MELTNTVPGAFPQYWCSRCGKYHQSITGLCTNPEKSVEVETVLFDQNGNIIRSVIKWLA